MKLIDYFYINQEWLHSKKKYKTNEEKMAIENPDINTNIDNKDKNLVKTFEGKIIKNLII